MIAEAMISALRTGASIKSALTIIHMSAAFLSRRARLSLRSQSRKITILMVVAVKLVGIVESRVQYTYVPLATNFLIGGKKMRDPKRIDKFCDLLKELWKRVPDWRFGQLISNLGRQFRSDFERTPGALFYMEDEAFLEELNIILAKFNEYENKYK